MAGGLLQLNSEGDENHYINGNPEINFFKNVYMRHTNFVFNTFQVNSNYSEQLSFDNTTKLKVRIPRNGDLISHTLLKIDLPDIYSTTDQGFKFIENIGEIIIKSAKLMIEDQVIEELRGEYIYIQNNIYNSPEKQNTVNNMSGNISDLNNPVGNIDKKYRETTNSENYTNAKTWLNRNYLNKPTIYGKTLYIPLPFWFTKQNGLSLPIIALKYHTVYIDLELRPLKELIIISKKETITLDKSLKHSDGLELIAATNIDRYYESVPDNTFDINTYLNGKTWDLNIRFDISYIFLDNSERNELVKRNNLYLIEQVQYREAFNISGKNFIEMELFHPVKEMLIFARRSDINTTNQWTNFTNLDYENQKYKQFQTYFLELCSNQGTDEIIEKLGAFRTNSNNIDIRIPSSWTSVTNNLQIDGNKAYSLDDIQSLLNIWNKRSHTKIPSINKSNFQFYNNKIIENMSIFFNSNNRLENKTVDYFTDTEYLMNHNNSKPKNLLFYSFAKNPEIFQPTGMCNFSEIKKLGFDIKTKFPSINGQDYKYDLHFYFVNYNILDIRHGMGGLVYGNK